MSASTHLQTIRTYYRGCSTCDADSMLSALHPDVVRYFTGTDPVRGAGALAAYCGGPRYCPRPNRSTVQAVPMRVASALAPPPGAIPARNLDWSIWSGREE